MPGASNEWIARKIKRILEEINPQYIVVHWAYLHRTESNDTRLTDEARRKEMLKDISIDNQVNNFKRIRDSINKGLTKIIESGIPSFFPIYTHKEYKQKITTVGGEDWPDLINIALEDFNLIDNWIKKELEDFEILDQVTDYLTYKHFLIEFEDIIFVEQVDLARDGKHYDILTANNFVDSIIKVL
jgi:hypothetical protein